MKVKLEFDLDVPTDNQEYMMLMKAPKTTEDLERAVNVLKDISRILNNQESSSDEKVHRIFKLMNPDGK